VIGSWIFAGVTAPHSIELVARPGNPATVEAWIDGRLARAVGRSGGWQYISVSGPEGIDGREVTAYVRGWAGSWVAEVDAYADGPSMTTGVPVGVLWQHLADADSQRTARGCAIAFAVVLTLVTLALVVLAFCIAYRINYFFQHDYPGLLEAAVS
jgi:hypothetical protein